MPQTTNKTHETPMLTLRAAVRPETVDIEARTVELVWTTGAKGRRWNWDIGSYLEELEVSDDAVKLDRLNNGAPLLNVHNQWELRSVLAVVEKAWLESGEGHALVRFSQRDDADEVFKDVKDGILRNISVGYTVHRYVLVEGGEDALPLYRAVDWEPMELSLVPVGFDDGAKVRSAKTAADYDGQRFNTLFETREADTPTDKPAAVANPKEDAYAQAPQTWRPLGQQTTVPDFRAVTRAALGDISALEEVKEHGEYKYGKLEEEGAPIRVLKYGKIIAITWEAVVNDDLSALTRIPKAYGAAAAQTESNLVWNMILSNPNFTDGKAIYVADHGNLAGAGGAINTTTLGAARAAMRKQQSKAGAFLNVEPRYLVVGPDKELEAFQFTSSQYVPAKNADINDSRNTSLIVIVDGRITGNQWYLFTEPGLIDTFEYAYLEGEPGVFTETREGFEVDGVAISWRKVFLDSVERGGVFVLCCGRRLLVEDIAADDGHVVTAACMEAP